MRTLAIGDIHGCSTALRALLDVVQPGPEDLLITLGDYVDRGPDSKGVLDTLLQLEKTTQLKPILGNHEILFIEAAQGKISQEGWLRVGGAETLQSYAPGSQEPTFATVDPAHLEFLSKRCLRYYEDASNLYVHANANAYYSLADQSDDWLFWTRFDDIFPHTSGKRIICGHTAQKGGWPNVKPYAICLDTWVYGSGWLTCMDVAAGTFVQANQAGSIRKFPLEEIVDRPTEHAIRLSAALPEGR
ncbi:MAG: serine/threonine protein phosphatase [Prosthecobacter sp.]|nr:serine/threonine protein phosphatase [Prosthecobacter sp.]